MGEIVTRYNVPTKFDTEEMGTIIKVIVDDSQTCVYYIQAAQDKENPKWERLGIILEKLFWHHLVDDQKFGKKLMTAINDSNYPEFKW